MSRAALVALAVGALGAAATLLLALSGVAVMPSCLGAWLFVLALPLGALPVVMGCEALGRPDLPLVAMLRRLVAVMPLAAVLALPVLLRLDALYPSLRDAKDGLPGWWMTPVAFTVRAILLLGAWTALSLVFARPAGAGGGAAARRRSLAVLGLGLHAVMGTLAAQDWAQAVEPGFTSSAFGLLLIAAQCSIAVSLAVVMTGGSPSGAETSRGPPTGGRTLDATPQIGTALAVLLGAWGFLAFTQYLVVWSANLPKEVVWYQHRAAGLGLAAEYSAGVLCALALVALLARGLSRRAGLLAWVAAALLVMHGVEMLWLVTPSFRPGFTVTLADALALAGAGGLGIGVALLVGGRPDRGRVGHGAA